MNWMKVEKLVEEKKRGIDHCGVLLGTAVKNRISKEHPLIHWF